jgi:hypothetical protein
MIFWRSVRSSMTRIGVICRKTAMPTGASATAARATQAQRAMVLRAEASEAWRGGLAVGRRLGRREVTSWHAFWHRCRRWSAMFFRRRPPQERPNDGCAKADRTTCRCCSNPPARNTPTPTPTRSRLGRESGEASAVTKPLPAKLGRAGLHKIGEVKPAA